MVLQGLGKAAPAAIPELIEALKDPVSPTRFMAAIALGRMGDAARSAVRALIERLRAPDEEFRVRRNIIRALGSIGPPAVSAIPALQEARKQEGLEQEVGGAIMRIHGQSPPTWHGDDNPA